MLTAVDKARHPHAQIGTMDFAERKARRYASPIGFNLTAFSEWGIFCPAEITPEQPLLG